MAINNMIDYNEFSLLDDSRQKEIILEYRKRYTNSEIMKTWGINEYEYYSKLLKNLGIRTNTYRKKQTKKAKDAVKSVTTEQKKETVPQPEPELEGMAIKVNGTFKADKVQNKLEKLALMLEEETEYQVEIKLIEKM